MKLYKVLIAIGDTVRSFYRDYTPYLPPMEGVPGPWLPAVGKPRIYASGYVLSRASPPLPLGRRL